MIGEVCFTTLIYGLLALVIIFPPEEAVSSGLTLENVLSHWLGSESMAFVHYHIKRTSATIIAHSLLFPGYILTILWLHPWILRVIAFSSHPWCWQILFGLSLTPLTVFLAVVYCWSRNGWRNHPFAKTIHLYTSSERSLASITSEINNEFIGVDKVSSTLNSVSRIIATDSWLIKVTSYKIHLTSLRDAILVLESSEDAPLIPHATSPAQFLNVRVASVKEGIRPFSFRINSSLWQDLDRKLINPVVNTRQIVVHQTLADRFAIVFEEAVKKNPTIRVQTEPDFCIGCMAVKANVKLDRKCHSSGTSSECKPCSCRVLWCLSCVGKWFAAKQDQTHTDTWLSSRAPCPTCLSKFCLLDVCIVES